MEENRSGLCTASLVLGIISLLTCLIFNLGFLPGVVGLIMGIICLAKKKQPKGRAVGGLITSIIGIVVGFIGSIIAVIIILSSGMLVGGAFMQGVNEALDDAGLENVNVIDNLNNTDNNTFSFDNDDQTNDDFDFDFDFDDGNDDNGSGDNTVTFNGNYDDLFNDIIDQGLQNNPEDVKMKVGTTVFLDLEKYGYTFSHGEQSDTENYAVYTNDHGAEFEFPAYAYEDYTLLGSTRQEAYENYLDHLGIYDADNDLYYDEELIDYNDTWCYGTADRITDYNGGAENGGYSNYEVWLFAFNKKTNDMVILIGRPTAEHFDDDIDELISLIGYLIYSK